MIFKCTGDMYDFAIKHIQDTRPDWCKICTYGIWVPRGYSHCTNFFRELEKYNIPTYIVVGDTGKNDTKTRVKDITSYFPNVKIKLVKEMHAKIMLFSDGTFICGSMNITDSKYNEIAMSTHLSKMEMLDMIMYIDGIP